MFGHVIARNNGKICPCLLYTVRCMSKTHYQLLGVDQKASQEEIKTAYREMSKKLHPDLNPHDPKTHDKFIRLKEAYTTISTPAKKKTYDKYLAGVQRVIKMKIKENDSEKVNHGGGMRYTHGAPSPMDIRRFRSPSQKYQPKNYSQSFLMSEDFSYQRLLGLMLLFGFSLNFVIGVYNKTQEIEVHRGNKSITNESKGKS
ncbi:dnaJ homolog subfamily C member 4-like isoform X2 [Mytilus californianus]|uniref:dnaJ homolog subfamily C member 4-like isoform X2 n=1 Tax=Mytilus californianus TaxID=6549 RepID=UPI0022484B6F|nr:dnaJ homolog subfamily C member 4-like isoform X2 [Mytilus californianus]